MYLTERIRVSLLRPSGQGHDPNHVSAVERYRACGLVARQGIDTVKADPSSPKLGTLDIQPARVPRFQQEEQPIELFRLPTFFREVRRGPA